MAVAHDNAASNAGSSVTSLSWSHTSAGANRGGVAGLAISAGALLDVPTWGGLSMTQESVVSDPAPAAIDVYLYSRINQGSGAQTVSFSWDALSNVVGGSESMTGVNQTDMIVNKATNNGNGTATVDVTSAVGELVVDSVGFQASGTLPTVGADQTQRWNTDSGVPIGAGSTEPGAATVTMSWTRSPAVDWAIAAASIEAAPEEASSPDQLSNYFEYQF